ncbi:hypothetical protein HELRODRAFT_172642 [Helobdella robusta]|uniref:Uncharacterized protein n=1 Tax=Helobdella robusta TaxID=6412 RepID=T1F5P7_HELRO|nr:hypothetical protein HELRODRAFT_172642 [Helobdella robusta]ESO04285.1 hypothetical protein HELRODRAFT_172642 [Helobdella robusta]
MTKKNVWNDCFSEQNIPIDLSKRSKRFTAGANEHVRVLNLRNNKEKCENLNQMTTNAFKTQKMKKTYKCFHALQETQISPVSGKACTDVWDNKTSIKRQYQTGSNNNNNEAHENAN